MKQRWEIIVTVVLVGLLAGCSAKSTAPSAKPSKTSSKVKSVSVSQDKPKAKKTVETTSSSASENSQTSASQSSSAKTALWDDAKKQALQTFMGSWGTTMGQTYQSYDLTRDSDYAGIHFPSQLTQTNLSLDDVPITAAWSTDGSGSADYNVVAVYCDEDQKTVGGHLYLFTFHDGAPVVLLTTQNQAMPDNRLHFNVTGNADLKAGFTKIVNEQTTTNTTSTSSTTAEKAITFDEAVQIVLKNQLPYHDDSAAFTSSKMSNQNSLPNGGIEIKCFGGAQGMNLFKLTPKPNNRVNITAQYGSIRDGQDGETAPIAKDITVAR